MDTLAAVGLGIIVAVLALIVFLVTNNRTSGVTKEPRAFATNIEEDTLNNALFRKVLYTTHNLQLVLMSLAPCEEIGLEQHDALTQFIRAEAGHGVAVINGEPYPLNDGDVVIVPPGAPHNVINLSTKERLQLYSLYSPPQHPPDTIHRTKADDAHVHV